jgi:flagellar protein FliJ
MSGLNGLQVALDLALGKRDAAAQVLAQVRQAWLAAQVQLDQLESYAQETTTRWGIAAARCTPELMRHHYQFMERLTHAIGLQTGIVTEHGRAVGRHAEALREAERKLEGLRQLHAARRREWQQLQDRRDQKLSDEHAAMQYCRTAASQSAGGH